MKLSFLDRMMLGSLLPATGSFVTIRILRELKEALAPTEEEIKGLNIGNNTETGQVTWNPEKDQGKEITIGEAATELIKNKLKDMDTKEELTENHFGIYEKFMGDK